MMNGPILVDASSTIMYNPSQAMSREQKAALLFKEQNKPLNTDKERKEKEEKTEGPSFGNMASM